MIDFCFPSFIIAPIEPSAEYPQNITLANLFEEQVYKTPDKIAITFENTIKGYL